MLPWNVTGFIRSGTNKYMDAESFIQEELKNIEVDNCKYSSMVQHIDEPVKFSLDQYEEELRKWKKVLSEVREGRNKHSVLAQNFLNC